LKFVFNYFLLPQKYHEFYYKMNAANLNHPTIRHCFVSRNLIFPEYHLPNREDRILAMKTAGPDSFAYKKYICTHCPDRKKMVARKDPSSAHYRCIKKCCPLAYHWNLCAVCIETIHSPVKESDLKRRSDAARFQRIFSKLPEDLQKYVAEYVPDVFVFVRLSGRLLLNGANQFDMYANQPLCIWVQISNVLRAIDYVDGHMNRVEIRERLKKLYQSLVDAHLGHVITDKDFWDFRGEVIRCFVKRMQVLHRIQKVLCPATLHKYLVAKK
jgi:hypothetical protein